MKEQALGLLQDWATAMPLPVFVVVGSLVEEFFAPIPSPFVMMLAGSMSSVQGQSLALLPLLALLAAIAKTIGFWLYYVVAAKLEDVVTSRFGRMIGITHAQVEELSARLNRDPKKDFALVFALRAIPVVPTAPVSLVAGLLQLNLRVFLISSFLGAWVRAMLFLYLGATSVDALERIGRNFDSVQSYVTIGLAVILVALLLWRRGRRKRRGEDGKIA